MIPSALRQISPRRGVILVMALWIAMLLSIMALSVAYELRINLRLARMSQNQLRARGLARAGLAKAVIDLKNDHLLAVADPANRLSDSNVEVWAKEDDKIGVELGGGTFSVYIDDEDGKFNLSLLSPRNVPIAAHVLSVIGDFDPDVATWIAYMIYDYQDADLTVWNDPFELESDFYTRFVLEDLGGYVPLDWTFKPKNDQMMSVEELLAIPGITRELLYGDLEDLLAPRVDRFELREESPALNQYLTVNGGRAININTCSTVLLEAIMRAGLTIPADAPLFVDRIHLYRLDLARAESGGKNSIININELRGELIGLGTPELNRIAQVVALGVSSENFRIISRGEYRGIRKTLEVQVSVSRETYAVNPDRPRSSGRRNPRARGSLTNFENVVIDPAVRVKEMRDY